MGAGVVSHEIAHLMIDVFRYRRLGAELLKNRREEELFATITGDLNKAFWDWWLNGDDGARFSLSSVSKKEFLIRRTRKPH